MRAILHSLLSILALLALTSCTARPKIYAAPDASKVAATTKRLSAAIGRAEVKVQEAQASSDKVAAHSASVLIQVHDLEQLVPAELKPRVAELKASIDAQIQEEGILSTAIGGARSEIAQVKKERDQLVVDQAKYQADAKRIAEAATAESRQKVEYQKQLTSQKIFKWLWRIGGGAAVIAIVVLFVTGKISFAAIRAYFGR